MRITSPTSGSTVGGTISVDASVSSAGVLVQRVQFQLDGANLGAADTDSPYSVPWNTKTASNGSHTLRAVAQDAIGMSYPSDPVTITVFNDITPPSVSITAPTAGSTVTGTITVSANASDDVGVVGVQFQLDGNNLGAETTTAPYSVPWNTATAVPGAHTLRALARDAANNVGTSTTVTVTVPDTTPPTASVTSPASGATVSGSITVSANASDNVGVVGVQFQLDSNNLGAENTTAPYSITWDTTATVPGSHTLRAIARDAAGNTGTSATVTVTVRDITPPTVSMTSPTSGSTISGAVAVSANASDIGGVAGVQFQLDGNNLGAESTTAPYSITWDTVGAADGTHSLRAIARDAAGNTATSASVTVTITNDRTPPAVTITSPSPGATVGGVVTVTASASDNVGVAGVQFQLDGNNLGAEDTTAPYSVTWDTGTGAPGAHSLTAMARDLAHNTATSPSVSVTVSPSGAGDVFVAIVDGSVQWHNPDGTLRQLLPFYSDGQSSSVAFDAAGNVYVPHWWGHSPGMPGNTVVRYDTQGKLLGTFGSGYNEDPSSFAFDAQGNVYVGQADSTGDILKFDAAGNRVASFDVATAVRGTDHIDLAADGCTMFYTSRTKDVFRFDVCTNTQLPFFNTQLLPGEMAFHIRVLPDGGVLVADSNLIVRLDASGNQIQTYFAPGESNYWGGLDLVGDGTFWASNASTDNIYKFDLQSGAILARFSAGSGMTAAGVGVRPIRR